MRLLLFFTFLVSGYTSTYAPGVFETVIRNRQTGLTRYDVGAIKSHIRGYIAVEDCSLINQEVLACFGDSCERLLIVDCAGVADGGRAWMQRTGIVGEVDPGTFSKYKVPGEALEMNLYLVRTIPRYKFE